jgi:hypothetical protein
MIGNDYFMLFPILGLIVSVVSFVKVYRATSSRDANWTDRS